MSLRWAVLILGLANAAVAGYLIFIDREPPARDVRSLEMNADKVTLLNAASGAPTTACLEWSNLGEMDLARAQEQLAKLQHGNVSVRERALLIADPSPALVAHLTELKAAFVGSELRAIACQPSRG